MLVHFALLFSVVVLNTNVDSFSPLRNMRRLKHVIVQSSLQPNTFSFSEESAPKVDTSKMPGFEALLPDAETVEMTDEELKTEWKSILKELKKSTKLPFYLRNVLPAFYSGQSVFKLTSAEEDKKLLAEDEVYLTESELKRLWQETSFRAFGKPITKFNILEALLLLPDEEEEDVMGEDTLYDIALKMDSGDASTVALDNAVESVDPLEYVFTTEVSYNCTYVRFCNHLLL